MLMTAAFAVGCSDDSAEKTTTPSGNDSIAERMQQFQDSSYAIQVINNLYELKTEVPSADSAYAFKYGILLDETSQNTYYIACKNPVEALDFFKFYCSNQNEDIALDDTAATNLKDRECTFGQFGKTTLHFSDGNPVYASITVSMTQVGKTNTLLFVPQAYIDNNNGDVPYYNSPYEVGTIVKDEVNAQWLCVTASQPGVAGLLVRMSQDGYRVASVSDYEKTVYYRKHTTAEFAGNDAWNALVYGAKYMNLDESFTEILNKTHEVNMDEFIPVVKYLRNTPQPGWYTVQQTGEAYNIDTHWWYYWSPWSLQRLYTIQIPFVRLEDGKSFYVGVSSSCKEFRNCDGRIGTETLKTGSQLYQMKFYADTIPGVSRVWPLNYH